MFKNLTCNSDLQTIKKKLSDICQQNSYSDTGFQQTRNKKLNSFIKKITVLHWNSFGILAMFNTSASDIYIEFLIEAFNAMKLNKYLLTKQCIMRQVG